MACPTAPDDKGNLYLSAFNLKSSTDALARLARGTGSVESIALNTELYSGMPCEPSVHWDGKHMAVSSFPAGYERQRSGNVSVYQLKLSERRATVIGTTASNSPKNYNLSPSSIEGKYIAEIYDYKGYSRAGLWAYPLGGQPMNNAKVIEGGAVTGATIGVAP